LDAAVNVEAFKQALAAQLNVPPSQISVETDGTRVTATVNVPEAQTSQVRGSFEALDLASFSEQVGANVATSTEAGPIKYTALPLPSPPPSPPPASPPPRAPPTAPPAAPSNERLFEAPVDERVFMAAVAAGVLASLLLVFLVALCMLKKKYAGVDRHLLTEQPGGTAIAGMQAGTSTKEQKRELQIRKIKDEYRAAGFSTVAF